MITSLQINNYKSIKQLNLDCRRINVLIGEPNAGKSNILEALDLSYLSSLLLANKSFEVAGKEKIDLKKFFRVDNVADLFHNGDLTKPISIINYGLPNNTYLAFDNKSENHLFELSISLGNVTYFDNNFITNKDAQFFSSPIKPYRFKENVEFSDPGNYLDKLMPPFGNNLLEVIKYNKEFRGFVGELLEESDWEFNLDISEHKLMLQKRISSGLVYSLPYKSLADTLRRIIFYTAAIRYNNGHVITLEEPDTHAFPKFVSFLGDEIIENNKNQFFIATHNPYLLNNLIENTPENELSIFVCAYDKNKGTIAKRLSGKDLSELLDYGVDIFFNINHYLDDTVEHSS